MASMKTQPSSAIAPITSFASLCRTGPSAEGRKACVSGRKEVCEEVQSQRMAQRSSETLILC